MDLELEGKNAIVTGGSLGIGKAIALALGSEGVNICLNYRRHGEEAKEVVRQIEKAGAKAIAIRADVSNFSDAKKMVEETTKNFGGIDILVCNAGINRDAVVWKMSEEDWDSVISINLKGYFNFIRNVAPIFRQQKRGKIVCITSINGLRGKFGQANYSASKAGIIGLVKATARELGKYNVNCNAVAPGLIETEMVKKAPEKVKEMALNEIVLGKLGSPEEVAWTVVFLCSERAKHITGEVIKVDGGQYI